MSTTTPNLGLTVPAMGDQISSTIPALGTNFQTLDNQVGTNTNQIGILSDNVSGNTTSLLNAGDVQNADNLAYANWQSIQTLATNNIIRKIWTSDSLPHVAFPTIEVYSGTIYSAWRQGTNHTSYDGQIVLATSTDSGTTWATSVLMNDANIDYRDPILFLAPNGNMIMKYTKRTSTANGDNDSVWFKIFNGTSWGSPISCPVPSDYSGVIVAQRGSITVCGSNILCPVYCIDSNNNSSVYVVQSTDNGQTWQFLSYITKNNYNETALCYLNGKVYAVLRDATWSGSNLDYLNRLSISVSTDNGATWSPLKHLPLYGHCPTLFVLNNRLIMTYRATNSTMNKNGKIEIDMVMLRDTALDSPVINLLWATNIYDMGYADVKISGTNAYVVYYYPSGGNYTIAFIKVDTNYLNGINILGQAAATNFISNNVTYIANTGAVSTKTNVHLLMGDIQVTGNGANTQTFTLTLDKSYSLIYNVFFTVKNNPAVFVTNINTFTGTGNTITGELNVTTGTFSGTIPIYWMALVTP